MVYAADTKVPVTTTQQALIGLLKTRGATQIVNGWSEEAAQIGFQLQGRIYKMTIPIPPQLAGRSGRGIPPAQIERSRWRTLLLVVKAKLEAVDAGLSTVEQEFLSSTVMPDGRTVFEHTQDAIEQAYVSGSVSPLLAVSR